MPQVALSALQAPGIAMELAVTGSLTYGDVAADVTGSGELTADSSHLMLSIAASQSLVREGIVAGGAVYERADGGPWTRERRRPGFLARDPADAGATVRLGRIIGRIEELSQSGWVAGASGTLYRLSTSAASGLIPSDLGLQPSMPGFAGSLQVMATWEGAPRILALNAGWIDPPTGDRCSWHLELALLPSTQATIVLPRPSWRSFASELDGYRIAYPPNWSIAECMIGGLSGRCLSADDGTSELLIRRFAPGSDRTIEGLAAAQQSALQEGAGLELSSTEQLALGLQPAMLLTYEGWEATVRQVLTVRGNDAYSLLWLSHGRTENADRAQLNRLLSTFEPSGSNSQGARRGDAQAASVPELETGAAGPDVFSLQARLVALHYDIGAVDGSFGDATSHAVVAFQKVNGLSPTGIADSATWSALFHPFVPKAKYDYPGASIEVDLTRQVVYLVRDGKIESIFDASTGGGYEFVSKGVTKVALTPTGTYRIYLQIDGWYESSVGWMYRSSFFLRGFALHGEVSVPPFPASHGCVRVTLSAINRLWPSLYLGMLVSIYRT
jgi:N-acetylmuramoyl-L-alanine amidase